MMSWVWTLFGWQFLAIVLAGTMVFSNLIAEYVPSSFYSKTLKLDAPKKVNAPTRKHNTPRGAALPGERTTARTAVFTGMCMDLLCQKKKREVTRAGSELATLSL